MILPTPAFTLLSACVIAIFALVCGTMIVPLRDGAMSAVAVAIILLVIYLVLGVLGYAPNYSLA